MGAANSRIEEDKASVLCRERKKLVKEALDGRCLLAATHVAYIESLKIVGTALWRYVGPEAPVESSLLTSTSATPDPLTLNDKSFSQFSYSPPSMSQHVDATGNLSPSPSPPTSSRYQENHMKFGGSFSRKIETKLSVPVTGCILSSSTPQSDTLYSTGGPEASPSGTPSLKPETPQWDYFGLSHPIDDHFSSQEGRGLNQGFRNGDNTRLFMEKDGFPEQEEGEETISSPGMEKSQESEDEFDEPPTDMLVRTFVNVNRDPGHGGTSELPSAERVNSASMLLNGGKRNSPDLSPSRPTSSGVAILNDKKRGMANRDAQENRDTSKDFFSSMREIEHLFMKASESGQEVPRMLEANKFHYRPIFPGKERGSMTSTLLKNCFSCGEDLNQVQEEPAEASVKYLTWHRTLSSRSSSSRNPPGSRDDMEEFTSNLFVDFCMISGSHASTLDRLYAWEKKLYDEVKASEQVRREYDRKCKLLRQLESNVERSNKIDKTRAVVKDLHSRIRVAIHRIDSISKKIEELRDQELQPQLEELIEGLRRMWVLMFQCHRHQFNIISAVYDNANFKISSPSEAGRLVTIHLESELNSLSSSFTKWIGAQKIYLKAINDWLFKCVSLAQKSSKRKRKMQPPPLRKFGPPIYVTCGVWLDALGTLPTKEVADSTKFLASEITRHLPRQEKNEGKGMHPHSTSGQAGSNPDIAINLLSDDTSEDHTAGNERFKSALVNFIGHLNIFSESSVKMFTDLQKAIQEAKISYDQLKSQQGIPLTKQEK
ncbi:nitrate regulatory gene2 protein [Diospyros lotus]|uniref:nitrate regulatory gene2 protein n=1 Tax=Diospyros lotus TaxID=55363 RepID=UPI00225671A6|nr:nitrate regulatory gene2 protein [Diospyros lotus]XP_052199532.1 nitrate regulatory gene2 protein [Diospyros lotus]XP_052199539.1 nitrate regulatory gene2 protein [Diospyros lotus]XP_052199546.1 nitrate regulatory gene2 protein [Diospyros lotus]XP_052199552.1 nitrate regulatory gene2 protein [Diospyros lotus]XP_052199558.1 nitrate regulatory gene2 protein [Diospyros lotus]